MILYHKPPNLITSHSNKDAAPAGTQARKTVYDDILSMEGHVGGREPQGSFEELTGVQSKLHAIGRLDAETSGLLLLTNDGGLVHHVSNPTAKGNLVTKTYEAVIMGHYEENAPDLRLLCETGVDIGKKYGGMTRPADDLQVLGHPTVKSTRVSITISEGKNRQVRRMFHAIQSGVMKLKRTNIGSNLTLDGLEEGQWRLLTTEEIRDGLDWETRTLVKESSTYQQTPRRRKSKSTRSRRRET